MVLYYYPQWIFICTWRCLKLLLESLSKYPLRFGSVPRLFFVALLSMFALTISYLHLSVVFVEQLIVGLFTSIKPYRTLFIVGPPRSGTTRMHKLMAADKNTFTAMKMWMIFFAPAISQKILFKLFGKIDALFGSPFYRLIRYTEKSLYKNFNKIHNLSIFNVEEDGLILFHLFSCYHLSFLWGKETSYDYLNHDKEVPKAVWAYYKICINNHMFLNRDKIYLSKNPFFSASVTSLLHLFHEPKFIHTNRDLNKVVPSFFSLKTFLSKVFYGKPPNKESYESIYKSILFWNKAPTKETYKAITIKADFTELTSQPINLIQRVYRLLNLAVSPEYERSLKQEQQKAKDYKSEHKYSIKEFDLNSWLEP